MTIPSTCAHCQKPIELREKLYRRKPTGESHWLHMPYEVEQCGLYAEPSPQTERMPR